MMTILRMLTGVFAVAAGVFGRRRPPARPAGVRRRAEERRERSLGETRATMRRRMACCGPSGPPDSAEPEPDEGDAAKLRRAAGWHARAAAKCRGAGDEDGHREHSAHAAGYLRDFRGRMGRATSDSSPVRAVAARRAAKPEARVRVQCPKCLVRQEHEISLPPALFHYACPDRGCEGSERAWGWDEIFCEVVPPRRDGSLEFACNAVDPAGMAPATLVWVTGRGRRVRPADMSNGHLVNTIRYIRRRAAAKQRAGEAATGVKHPRWFFLGKTLDVYQEMLREADERGLKYDE